MIRDYDSRIESAERPRGTERRRPAADSRTRVTALQRAAGNRAMATIARAGRATGAQRMLARKIGFEFEYAEWRTHQPKKTSDFAAAVGTATTWPDEDLWDKVPKGKALVRGDKFEVQADDAQGGGSDMEIVTDPFEESVSGRADLAKSMASIVALVQGLPGQYWGVKRRQLCATDLPGTAALPTGFFSTDRATLKAKPQTTFGVRLDQIATLLEDLYLPANEAAGDTQRRRKGRKQVGGVKFNVAPPPVNIPKTIGEAPGEARTAVNAHVAAVPNAPAASNELISLVSLIVAYTNMAANNLVRSYAKTIAPVMARTDFAAMYKLLTKQEQKFYKAHKSAQFLAMLQRVPSFGGLDLTAALYEHGIKEAWAGHPGVDALKRDKWFREIPQGTDLLTGKKFPDKTARGWIEGMGALGKKTETVGQKGWEAKAPIVELRSVPSLDPADLAQWADRIFVYAWMLNAQAGKAFGEP